MWKVETASYYKEEGKALKQKKTYFVSDVHLGAPALANNKEREALFVSWLDMASKDADSIYLLGDIFDFWYEYKKVAPRGFVRTLGKLAEITDKGIPVYYFTGNHDVWLFDYLPDEIGVKIFRKPIDIKIGGKRFFIGHGDGLDPKEKGYLFLKSIFVNKVAQFFFSMLHPDLAFAFAHSWAKKSRLDKGLEPKTSKGPEFESEVAFAKRYRKENDVDYFVLGHRHILMEEKIDEKSTVFILGEWLNYFSYAVFDGEKLELKRYDKVCMITNKYE